MLSTFERSKHPYQHDLFDYFDHPHVNAVAFVSENSPKSHRFFHKAWFFVEKVFDMYLLVGLSSLFSLNSRAFLKNCYLIVVLLKN